jgi:peptidoglycan/xylan/chitin deacetylase (PgdA/CDA1 family)
MKFSHILLRTLVLCLVAKVSHAQDNSEKFSWPEGKTIAVSLSFDDARHSQVDKGTALLDQYGVKATFFVVPAQVEERLDGWRHVVANGHEIGNHTRTHPCSGNYVWSRQKALENFSLKEMRQELESCNGQIERLLGVVPGVFAYPCGHTYVGRGTKTKSYVPLVSKHFFAARTYRDNISNDPAYCDLAQLTGIDMDEKDFGEILQRLEYAKQHHHWVILGGHEIGESGHQTTRLSMLKELLDYASNPSNGIWIAPVGTVARYLHERRRNSKFKVQDSRFTIER